MQCTGTRLETVVYVMYCDDVIGVCVCVGLPHGVMCTVVCGVVKFKWNRMFFFVPYLSLETSTCLHSFDLLKKL